MNGFGRMTTGVGKEREQLFRRQRQPEFSGKFADAHGGSGKLIALRS